MILTVLYGALIALLLTAGGWAGLRYAHAYAQAINDGELPNWATAMACLRLSGGVEITSPRSFASVFVSLYVGLLLALAVLWQSSLVSVVLLVLLMPLLLALCRIDQQTLLLPDALLMGVLLLGLVYAVDAEALGTRCSLAIAVYLALRLLCWVYERVSQKLAMGAGDSKLIAVLQLWFDVDYFLPFIGIAALLALLFAAFSGTRHGAVPFGPPLIMAGVLMVAIGVVRVV